MAPDHKITVRSAIHTVSSPFSPRATQLVEQVREVLIQALGTCRYRLQLHNPSSSGTQRDKPSQAKISAVSSPTSTNKVSPLLNITSQKMGRTTSACSRPHACMPRCPSRIRLADLVLLVHRRRARHCAWQRRACQHHLGPGLHQQQGARWPPLAVRWTLTWQGPPSARRQKQSREQSYK